MSIIFPGTQPSYQHQRELDARLRGERTQFGTGNAATRKSEADRAFEAAKLAARRAPSADGAADRVAQARAALAGAQNKREVDLAFEAARRSLRR